MNSLQTNDALNRLLIIHYRSLAMYLSYAVPYWHRGDEAARETLQIIVDDQKHTVDRLGEWIIENNGTVEYGTFPMKYTGYHDLDMSFLLQQLVEQQKRDIDAIAACVEMLESDVMAKAIAEETLGAAKGHLELLNELRNGASIAMRS